VLIATLGALLVLWGRAPSRIGRVRDDASAELRFLNAVAADLRAGMSLRLAIAAAAGQLGGSTSIRLARLARAGAPLPELATALAGLRNGRRVAGALAVADVTGAKAAAMFAHLAAREAAELALLRERRALTTQARLSALVVGGLPLVLLLVLGGPHRLVRFAAGGRVGLAVVLAGLLLQAAGGVVVWRMARAAA
jgi:Flp pilus assembly protein TadB